MKSWLSNVSNSSFPERIVFFFTSVMTMVCLIHENLTLNYNNTTVCQEFLYDPCSKKCHTGAISWDIAKMWPADWAHLFYGKLYPPLAISVIVATVFIIIVLAQKRMRNPANLVLLYMTIAGLSFAVIPFPVLLFFFIFNYYNRMEEIEVSWCYSIHYMFQSLPSFCQWLETWFTVLLAMQQLICIKNPLSVRRYCTKRNMNIISLLITIFCFVCMIPRLAFEIDKIDVISYKLVTSSDNTTVLSEQHSCILKYHPFVKKIGVDNYFAISFWFRAMLFSFIPCILLLILTILLLTELRNVKIRRLPLMMVPRRDAERKFTSTLMTTAVAVIFLAANFPMGLSHVLFTIRFTTDLIKIELETLLRLNMVHNLLILGALPLNFIIYCAISQQFRRTFMTILLCRQNNHRDAADLQRSLRLPVLNTSSRS